jgi:hypothetical protein
LHPPDFVEVVGVAEDRLFLVAGMNRAGDELVMFGVVTGLEVRLRIDIEVR